MKSDFAPGCSLQRDWFGFGLWSWAATASVLLILVPAAWALDTNQQALLRDAQSHLQKLETNLALAQQAAGPGEGAVPASKAKLAAVRLQSALDSVAQVQARLERLPGSDVAVKPIRERFDTVSAAVSALQTRLTATVSNPAEAVRETPRSSPASAPGSTAGRTPNVPATATTKLDYRQQEELKNARFYLDDIQAKAAELEKLANQVKLEADFTKLDIGQVQAGINLIAGAKQRAGLVTPRLAALPPNGQGVAEVGAELTQAMQVIEASEQVLKPVHAKLAGLVDPKNNPRLAGDTQRLREMGSMFYDQNIFQADLPRAGARIRELAAAQAEHDRVMESYSALLRQTTAEGTALTSASAYFKEQVARFSTTADAQRKALPGAIDADFAKIDSMVQDAVSNQKPAFFTQGIPDQMGRLGAKIDLLETLDASSARPLRVRLQETRGRLTKHQAALREAIVASNDLPRDAFKGGDRDELAKIATEAWRKVEPSARILAVRIPSPAWQRDVLWRNQTGDWYKIDRSQLQVQLIVRHSDTLAVIRPINLWKNHLESDRITATLFHGKGDELQPHDFLLLGKVK